MGTCHRSLLGLATAAALAATAPARAAEPAVAFVACAPGHPGGTAEAQPAMDAFAAAVARLAGLAPGQVTAAYLPTEAEGVERLGQASVAMVPLPFFLKHGAALRLTARLFVEQQGAGLAEEWSLVARKGRVGAPGDLAGFTVLSLAGYSPSFVRGAPGPAWRLPERTAVAESAQVLSALRRAVKGEDVAVLLDGAQARALPTLPFAADLEVLARSAPLPVAVVATVGERPGKARWTSLERALLALPGDAGGAAALAGIRVVRFAPADGAALAAARKLAGPGR